MPRSTSIASTCTVLLIDDNFEQLDFWSKALRNYSNKYSVLTALDGEEGLELLRRHQVDCVLLELDLPNTSGFKFLFDIVPDRSRPEIAVIILTHLPHPNLAEMAVHNGAQACLVKQSISADALDQAIQKAMTSVASAHPSM